MLSHETGLGQRVEQQMEVDDSCIGVPARHQLLNGLMVERHVDVEETPELVDVDVEETPELVGVRLEAECGELRTPFRGISALGTG
jgi:hypothetical protein